MINIILVKKNKLWRGVIQNTEWSNIRGYDLNEKIS